jgi:hypothetical protein
MKPRILGLAFLAAMLLAALWILRTERGTLTRAAPPALPSAPASNELDLQPPRADEERSRAASASDGRPLVSPILSETTPDSPAGGAVFGRLLDEAGNPVASETSPRSTWAHALDELGARHEATLHESTYRLDGLPPGRTWVTGRADGFRPRYETIEIAATEEVELDLVLAPSVELAVRVLSPEGEPHPDVIAGTSGFLVPVATSKPLGDWCFEIEGSIQNPNGEGRFHDTHDRRTEGLIGFLELDGELPAYVSLCLGQWVLATESVPAGSEEVTFTHDTDGLASQQAAIHVRAFDSATGKFLSGVHVVLHSSSMIMSGTRDESEGTRFEPIPPGRYGVLVTFDPYAWERRDVLAEPGKVTEVEIGMGTSVRIAGRFVDGEGRSIRRAEGALLEDSPSIAIGRMDPATSEVDVDTSMHYAADTEGRFSLPAGRGIHVLRAYGEHGACANVLVDTRQGSVDGVEIVLRPPADVVLRIESGAWQGTRFRILDEDGVEAQHGRFDNPMPHRLLLPLGTYRLLASDVAGTPVFETSFVATPGTVVVPVRL